METLALKIENNIATITFNRPTAMNAFNKIMGLELETVTAQVMADKSVRAVCLNGAGELFMAGGDIRFFAERLDIMPVGVMEIVRSLNHTIINLMQMPKPVLASVHGSVAGVGISLMSACDLVIAAENTKFTTAYTGIGISPDGGMSYTLPRLVGTKKAMEWLMLSELFDAAEAKQYGLINWVVSAENLMEQTNRLLKRLANGPTQSYLNIKKLVNETWQNGLETQLEKEGRAFEICSATNDFKAGVTGFLQKKKPEFNGMI